MTEHCPLGSGLGTDKMACVESCEALWNRAVETNRTDGVYDSWLDSSPDFDNAQTGCRHLDSDFSHDALHVVDQYMRSYVIVDECVKCGTELGEQGFLFTCPLPIEM